MRFLIPLVLILLLAGCVRITDVDGNQLDVNWKGQSFAAERQVQLQAQPQLLKALVKGSIYESGEAVSVFGTCLNASDLPLDTGTYATLNSWYPNGTLFFDNISMGEIQPGYYLYTGFMEAVQGTYLTEMICHVNGSDEIAKAWGEWQNPAWVARLSNMTDMLTDISSEIGNITISIGNLSENITNQFIQTWQNQNQTDILINTTYQNLSSQITVVGQIANASVDRNDSYIVQLLINLTSIVTPPSSGTLVNYTEDADVPVYLRVWYIRVDALDSATNRSLSYPDVMCDINTTQTTTTTQMTVQGEHFVYSERILYPSGDFSWTVLCYWL